MPSCDCIGKQRVKFRVYGAWKLEMSGYTHVRHSVTSDMRWHIIIVDTHHRAWS